MSSRKKTHNQSHSESNSSYQEIPNRNTLQQLERLGVEEPSNLRQDMWSRVESFNYSLVRKEEKWRNCPVSGKGGDTERRQREREGGSKRTAGLTHIPQDSSGVVITGAKQLNLLWLTRLHYHQPEDASAKERKTHLQGCSNDEITRLCQSQWSLSEFRCFKH